MLVLDINNLGFQYPGSEKWILSGFALKLNKGEVLNIRGRNGTGKSTLLKIISGIYRPTTGSIDYHGSSNIAYMDQAAGDMLAAGLTIEEHLNAFQKNNTKKEILSVDEILSEFNLSLENRKHEFVGHLSGGQRQIVALITLIRSGADIICLDEFVSALDDKSTRVALSIIKRLISKKDISIIMVSHLDIDIEIDQIVTI